MTQFSHLPVPPSIPVMLLNGCTLFPHALLPLFIYEPRYREMLRYALENDRMFCIGSRPQPPDIDTTETSDATPETDEEIFPCSTVGIVRACVTHPNGTSHLMLQGVSRVRLVGWEQRAPFRIAQVEPHPSIRGDARRNSSLAARLLEIVTASVETGDTVGSEIGKQLRLLDNPEALADFVAANFLHDPDHRHQILAAQEVGARLRLLLRWLAPSKEK